MFWLVFVTALVIDQASKLLATLYLEISFNQGISFGWLAELSSSSILILLIFSAMTMAYILRQEWLRYQVAAGLFWAGAISNLLDRILLGGVVDWISLPLMEIKNNLADFYLSIALLLLFIQKIRNQHES